MKNTLVLFCVFILFMGCSTEPKVDTAVEADIIRDLEDQWTEAIKTADVDKIIGIYATDAVSMPDDEPIATGLQNIRNRIESQFADTTVTVLFDTYSGTVDVIDVSVSGDLAYSRGHDEISVKTKDGLVIENGKWIDIYKKIDGQWKAVVSIGNSDKPSEENN
jgi:ketosteroid isomerase-like protein